VRGLEIPFVDNVNKRGRDTYLRHQSAIACARTTQQRKPDPLSGYTWARDDGEAVVEAARNNG